MRKTVYFSITFLMLLFCFSCEIDNYDEPKETLKGEIIDKETRQLVQTEAGNGGIRIRLLEYSWSDNPTPYYFFSKQDGSYNNTKIFKGTYNVVAEGAFIPLIQYNDNGSQIVDNSQTLDIKGTAVVNFEVEPFLRVEWAEEPVLNGDGSVTVNVKITRGTSNANFQQNITDVFLFVNSNPYVGFNNYDTRYSTNINLTASQSNAIIGQRYTIKTSGELPKSRTWYIRVGARINYNIAGTVRYNYNEVKSVVIP